ncbi:MAG: hypothetical protein ACE5FC_03320, partial [Myxococcota bacterium]
PFEAAQLAADEIRLTDEITGHEYDEELPGPIAGETAGGAGASELDLALEPLGESDASPGEPAEAPDDSQARAPVEPELPLPGAPAPDFGPAFGPDGLAGTDRDSRASVTPAELGEEEGDAGAIYSVEAGESFHPDAALPGGDVPLEHFLDNLDIGQSSLAPEARENPAAGFSGEGAPKEEPPDAASSTGSAIPLDGRVEELADQYRAQGQLHRARALYRALLEGNEMNLGVRSKLEELGEEPQLSPQGPPPHDRMVREKVEENIDSLNRWLANIKRGAAR